MAVAGEHQVRSQEAVLLREMVVPVGQQHPEGVFSIGGADFLRHRLRGLLVRVAVGIVDSRQHRRVPVPLQDQKLVGQHRHAPGLQGLFQLGHVPHGPFVVSGDVVGGGDARQARRRLFRVALRHITEGVQQIPHQKDIFRLLGLHGFQELPVFPAEPGGVQIPQHHGPAAVEARGQVPEDGAEGGHLQSRVVPADIESCQRRENQQKQQSPPPPPTWFGTPLHRHLRAVKRRCCLDFLSIAQGVFPWREEKYTKKGGGIQKTSFAPPQKGRP